MRSAAHADSRNFHMLWFNKFDWFDDTLLNPYYKDFGRRLVCTAHNISTADRDQLSGALNQR